MTCESHFADGRCRRENLLAHECHWLSSDPSCRSLRNGSSSGRCLGTLGNEGGCRGAGRRKRGRKIEARLEQLPLAYMADCFQVGPSGWNVDLQLWQCYICARAKSASLTVSNICPHRLSLYSELTTGVTIMGKKPFLEHFYASLWPQSG